MRSILFSLLPVLVAGSAYPEPWAFPEASPSPQEGIPHWGSPLCNCGANFTPPPCTGSWCECRNAAIMSCWVTRMNGCAVTLQSCPNTSEGPAGTSYPACGNGLAACGPGRVCRLVNPACKGSGCLGLCVPPPPSGFTALQPPKSPAQPKAPAQPAAPKQPSNPFSFFGPKQQPQPKQTGPKGNTPPAQQPPPQAQCNIRCDAGQVCVQDPFNQVSVIFKCIDGALTCGGWRNDPCPVNKICVRDPRMTCSGQGCTGLCA